MKYFCDKSRHVVCLPLTTENLHKMAKDLEIKKLWYHKSKTGLKHYDIPKYMIETVTAKCEIVTTREIIKIIRNGRKENITKDVISVEAQP